MDNQVRAYRFGSHIYDTQQIQKTLVSEIGRLEQQLDKVKSTESNTRGQIADTYREMIFRRKELLEIIRSRSMPGRTAEAEYVERPLFN